MDEASRCRAASLGATARTTGNAVRKWDPTKDAQYLDSFGTRRRGRCDHHRRWRQAEDDVFARRELRTWRQAERQLLRLPRVGQLRGEDGAEPQEGYAHHRARTRQRRRVRERRTEAQIVHVRRGRDRPARVEAQRRNGGCLTSLHARSASRDQSTSERGSREPLFFFPTLWAKMPAQKSWLRRPVSLRDRRNNVGMAMTMRS